MRRLLPLVAVLALAVPAAAGAATPKFGLWDLQSDLSHASRNTYGDVAVKPLRSLTGKGTVVRCGGWCRFGNGWLAFSGGSRLSAADVARASYVFSKRKGWAVELALRPGAVARWRAFIRNVAESTKLRGVPDVLVVVAGGQVAALPFATQVTTAGAVITLAGFSRASAKALTAQF